MNFIKKYIDSLRNHNWRVTFEALLATLGAIMCIEQLEKSVNDPPFWLIVIVGVLSYVIFSWMLEGIGSFFKFLKRKK
jgi:hypothetical protein